jgi:hypothetical protein
MEEEIKKLKSGDTVEIKCKTGLFRIVKIVATDGHNFTAKLPISGPKKISFIADDITRIVGKSKCHCH